MAKHVSDMNENELKAEQEKLLKKHWNTRVATDIIKAFEIGRRLGALTLKKK